MSISVGEKLPEIDFWTLGADGPTAIKTSELFKGKRVVLFGLPGAYTPICHSRHLPGYIKQSAELKKMGVDEIICTSTNDVFVLESWASATGAVGTIKMLSDGNTEFSKKVGLSVDLTDHGFGERSNRYSMLVEDGIVKLLVVEPAPTVLDQSSALNLLSCMSASMPAHTVGSAPPSAAARLPWLRILLVWLGAGIVTGIIALALMEGGVLHSIGGQRMD